MKKTTQLLALAIGLVIIAPSCKKYEEGPSISLRSKKGRMQGDWTVSAYDETTTSVSASGNTTVTTTSSTDGASLNVTIVYTPSSGSGSTQTKTGTMSTTFDIEKDGTYRSTSSSTLTYTQTGFFGNETVTEKSSSTDEGSWNFTAGVGELSKKQQMVMRSLSSSSTDETDVDYESALITDIDGSPTTTTSTMTGDETIYTILLLKSKEMKLKREWSNTSSTDGSANGSLTGLSTITFKQ